MPAKLKPHYRALHWLLGDQLNRAHSWFQSADPDVLFVIAELKQETGYTRHHVQKICGFFAAMDEFARSLAADGHDVLYLTLDDSAGYDSLESLVSSLAKRFQVQEFVYQRPDEHRLLQQFAALPLPDCVDRRMVDTEHFLLPYADIADQFVAGKPQRMEGFYRRMRRRFDILMEENEPAGGRWNFDADNRQKLRREELERVPAPMLFANDVSEIVKRLERHEIEHFGKVEAMLPWPINREQSVQLLRFFCQACLPNFGRYQDAMTGRSDHAWSLYHSRLSFSLNCKLLSPLEVIDTAIDSWRAQQDRISLAQIEGFVRQILGWREFVRGLYWANMPQYAGLNHFNAQRNLPEFFWAGNTDMHCLSQAIGQSLDYSYAHHIQRLMITGNFCLLAGIDPVQVDAWYLGIYIDAIEWVEMPNTRGMSQFADGGLVASKPYAASGNYVNKMSDYCSDCRYKVKEKVGDDACPLNSLYWHFMHRHRQGLEANPRIGMVYRNWDRQSSEQRAAVLARAESILTHLDEL